MHAAKNDERTNRSIQHRPERVQHSGHPAGSHHLEGHLLDQHVHPTIVLHGQFPVFRNGCQARLVVDMAPHSVLIAPMLGGVLVRVDEKVWPAGRPTSPPHVCRREKVVDIEYIYIGLDSSKTKKKK